MSKNFFLDLPKDEEKDILEFFSLSKDDLNKIIDIFKNTEIELDCKEFSKRLAKPLNINEKKAHDFYHMLIALVPLLNNLGVNKVIPDIINSVQDDNSNQDQLISFFMEFIKIENVIIYVKSKSILTKYPHMYINNSIKIISNIRPIFKANIENGFISSKISHSLNFKYKKGRNIENFYITLDKTDLEEFKQEIERAIRKDEILREFCDPTDLKCID